jgi:uncharacterized alpha-E superfamily protein
MLSRVAENLYWISRYVERAEGLARLLEDAHSMALEGEFPPGGPGPFDSVLLMLNAAAPFDRARTADESADPRNAVLSFLTFGRTGGISIRESVARARENARGTQEAVTGDVWSQLNKLHLFLNSPRAAARFAASPARFLARVRRECVLFGALVDGAMPRTEAYHFLQIGRNLERVDMLSRVINVHCSAHEPVPVGAEPAAPWSHWSSLLRGISAHEAYLQQGQAKVDPVGVVRYLLLQAAFPRSMRFGVARCLESLRCVAGGTEHATAAERHLGKLDSDLRYADVDDLFRRGIGAFLVGVQAACSAVARDIDQTYFRT